MGHAHEREGTPSFRETYMDLHNNMVGRTVGEAQNTVTQKEMIDILAQKLRNGELILNPNQVPGSRCLVPDDM